MPVPARAYTIAALYLRLVLGHGGPAAAFGYAGSPDVPDLAVQVLPGAADESRAQALPGEAYESCLQEPSGQVSALRAQEPLGEADDGAPRPLMPPEILVVTSRMPRRRSCVTGFVRGWPTRPCSFRKVHWLPAGWG